MKVTNTTKGTILAENAVLADNFFSRLTGLLGHKSLGSGQGMVLSPSTSIHSFFMRFTFDALFVDKNKRVIAAYPDFKPFRVSKVFWGDNITIELPAGTILNSRTQIGDELKLEK